MKQVPAAPSSEGLEQSRPVAEPSVIADPIEPLLPEDNQAIQRVEEMLDVSKKQVVTGKIRVSIKTELEEQRADVSLDHHRVDVIRVPVGQVIEAVPSDRTEGDTTIVSVVEERFVVVKQLYLKEELHIMRRIETELSQVPVTLRQQRAIVERIDADGAVDSLPVAGEAF